MKILITGGAGFIGSHLSLDLINCGHSVTVIDSLSPQIHGEQPDKDSYTYRMIKDKVRVITQSFISEELLKEELKETEIVIHLASETGTGQSMYELARYNYINVYGTALLLECLKKYPNKVRQFYLSSSRSIYGEGKYFSEKEGIIYPDLRKEETLSKGNFAVGYNDDFSIKPLPTDEESKIHPISIYGLTKKHQEDLVLLALKNTTIQPIIFRFQNVYGPGQSLKNPYTGVLSVFSTLARENKKIDIYEDGIESRDFVFISDIIQAFNCNI
jgi:dTDP-L-rhamnose 4-epimerase